jgi:arylsulfatase A-like enzyme
VPARNLILISLDTLRFDALSAAPDRRLLGTDAELARTPALDAIAAEGTFFARAVTTFPYTSPSHAAIFTGTHWPKHGVLDLFSYQLRPQVQTLAEALRERGWRTAQNAGRGWRNGDMFAMDSVGLNRGYQFQAFGGWLRRSTMAWLREAGARGPWYLFFHTMAVHRPYGKSHRAFRRAVARDLKEKTPFHNLARLYLQNVSDVDRRFGRLWKAWRRSGLLENTLVVIMSDHGEGISPHCTIHCSTGGWSEGVCRVPIILWAPGLVKAGQVIEEPVSTVDVAPTVADLLDLDWQQPAGFDGASAADVARGRAPASSLEGRVSYFFASMSSGPPPIMQGLVRGAQKYVSFAQAEPLQWQELEENARKASGSRKKQSRVYNVNQLLDRIHRGETELLFDAATDPNETRNLAAARPQKLEELRSLMTQWYRDHHPEGLERVQMDDTERREVKRRLGQLGYLE